MVGDVARQPLDVGERRHQLAEMAVDDTCHQPGKQRADQQPGEEEMDDPAGGEVVVRRDRRPARKRHIARLRRGTGHAEHAACVELRAEQFGVAARAGFGVLGADLQHVVVEAEARLVADIERRMRVEDLQPREQQEEQADRPDPVRKPRPGELAVDHRFAWKMHRLLRLGNYSHEDSPFVSVRRRCAETYISSPLMYAELRGFVTRGFLTIA